MIAAIAPPGRTVIRGVDTIERLVPERREGLRHFLLRFVRAPIWGVEFGDDFDLAVQLTVRALFERGGVRVGGRAIDHHDSRRMMRRQRDTKYVALHSTDGLGVEGDESIDCVGIANEAVVRDDHRSRSVGALSQCACRNRVDGIDHQHLRAVGQSRLCLLLLTRGVLPSVRVQQLALRAELLELLLEQRAIGCLVARGLRFRQQQRHLGRVVLLTGQKRQHHPQQSGGHLRDPFSGPDVQQGR